MTPTSTSSYQGLTASGWFMLLFCMILVCGLVVFCFYMILREPHPSEHHHAPLEIDTHDSEP